MVVEKWKDDNIDRRMEDIKAATVFLLIIGGVTLSFLIVGTLLEGAYFTQNGFHLTENEVLITLFTCMGVVALVGLISVCFYISLCHYIHGRLARTYRIDAIDEIVHELKALHEDMHRHDSKIKKIEHKTKDKR